MFIYKQTLTEKLVPDMLTALRNAGLASEQKLQEVAAEQQIAVKAKARVLYKSSAKREEKFKVLYKTKVVSGFRAEAHKLLLEQPDDIDKIADIAERRTIKTRAASGGRLMKDLVRLRAALSNPGLLIEERLGLVRKILPMR